MLDGILAGRVTLDRLRAWADSVRSLYVRPEIERFREMAGDERGALVDAYSDWEIREGELVRALRRALHVAAESEDSNSDLALKALQSAEVLAGLNPRSVNRAAVSFRIGYVFWRLQRYHEAIPHLAAAAEVLSGFEDEGWRELNALSYLVTCLREERHLDEALEAVERLLQRARQLGVEACEGIALRDRGMVQSQLGRNGAVADLYAALEIRKRLSEPEAREYAVPDQGAFLNDLGVVARKEGQFETATGAFLELVDFHRARNDQPFEALALSDLGYTYHASGEDERAAEYLLQAAELAERAGDRRNADRWRRQAVAFSPTLQSPSPEIDVGDFAIADTPDAYEGASVVEVLMAKGRFDEALGLGERVLAWARNNQDANMEMSILNDVAICQAQRGAFDVAIPTFRQAIRLADGLKNAPASLKVRHGLAKAYIQARKYQLAADVLWSALGWGEALLNATPGTEARQQVAAGMLSIHEVFASLLSQTQNHETMIATTELARTRNLLGWMAAQSAVATTPDAAELSGLLEELRVSEVELEVLQFAGTATAQRIEVVTRERKSLRGSLDARLAARGRSPVVWSPERSGLFRDLRVRMTEVLSTGDCIVFLFSVSEGVCAAAAWMGPTEVNIQGTFVEWERQDRLSALAPWFDVTSRRSTRTEVPIWSPELFEPVIATLRGRLFEPLAGLLSGVPPANLVVIPQGELALLPYWDLLRLGRVAGSLCVAPSLEAYLLCRRRSETASGKTVVVPDVTGSLRHSRTELESVRTARPDDVEECSFAEDIAEAAREAAVLHVVAHGVFNAANPYLGGFIMRERAPAASRLAQYVAPPRRFGPRPASDAWRLFTVAECMAHLSLGRCRVAMLSACESGIPSLHGGGEMTGLPNALVLAGAKSVVASLWSVHDAAAATLMHHFYEIWEGGRGETAGVGMSLRMARDRLKNTTRREVNALLGAVHNIPERDHPFSSGFFSDAFHCFGSG